jgi:hypothetical protein
MKYTNSILPENVIEEVCFTMVNIRFGLWGVTVCGLVDGCQYSMLQENVACIRQGGLKTRAALEPLATLQT